MGGACSGYLLTQPLPRSPSRVRSTATLQLWPDAESQIHGNWENINTLVAAANAREDFGGVVGGSYVAFCGVLAIAFFTAFSLSKPKKNAEVSLKPLWELPEFVPPISGANIRWKAGTTLPSLDELTKQCAIIGEELGREYVLCTAPVHDWCDPDEEFSAHYGQPVYVCRM